jgi:sugar transferase (PEP-CTERM system associated)
MLKQLWSDTRKGLTLVAADFAGMLLIFWYAHERHVGQPIKFTSVYFLLVVAVTILVLYIMDLYRLDEEQSRADTAIRTLFGVGIAGAIIGALIYLLPRQSYGLGRETIFWRGVFFVAMVLFAFWAIALRVTFSTLARRLASRSRWLLIGEEGKAFPLWEEFVRARRGDDIAYYPLAGGTPDTSRGWLVAQAASIEDCLSQEWRGVILAYEDMVPRDLANMLMEARLKGRRVYDAADFYERFLHKIPVHYVQDHWFVLSQGFDLLHHNVQLKAKRVIDVVLALALLAVTLPVMLVLALLIKLDSPGSVIYAQTRTGQGGKPFKIYKFRTMTADAEENGAMWAEVNDARITRVGRVLRRMRLDELPQIWNVLRGDMSFVGPRPERPDFTTKLEKQIPYYDLRHLVKPGISGWAQVMHSYGASVEDAQEKLQYDLYYIKNYSIYLDLLIAMKTIRIVARGQGR